MYVFKVMTLSLLDPLGRNDLLGGNIYEFKKREFNFVRHTMQKYDLLGRNIYIFKVRTLLLLVILGKNEIY